MMMKNVCQSYFFPSENVSLLNWGEKDASNMCAIHSKLELSLKLESESQACEPRLLS